MRITNGMMVQNMIWNINGNLNRLDKLQQQASSGKRIQFASEDPVAAARSLKMRNYVSEVEQLQKNTEDATSWMNFSESALKNLGENVKRIRELTVQASNGTNTDSDREKIKSEIVELKKSILDLGNSSFNSRYVFAGYDTDQPPFETVQTAVGEKVMYKGKYLSLGGVVSASVSDSDYKDFYMDNMDKISGQPELKSANVQFFTAAAPALDFEVVLDGVSKTISLTEGVAYDAAALQAELQTKLQAAFPAGAGQPDPLIKVSAEGQKLQLTVQRGTSIQINSGTLDVTKIGFNDGISAKAKDKQEILFRMGTANRICINVEGNEVFGQGEDNLMDTLAKLELALSGETEYKTADYIEGPPADVTVEIHDLDISSVLEDLDKDLNRLLKARADLGARTNYAELTQNRLADNNVIFTELLSKNEDADYAEVSMKLSSAETIYSAALSAGAKTIQHSLLDFLK